ncbi:MAG: dienelactone hydrolase family protein [Verrucomicrobia bacterium]|nr:dienelactone hydrolase family protein [Cytophagales bacterium]
MFEALAREGFVVVSVSSIGRYPGDMTMKNQDLMEQVDDAIATLNHLKKESYIDFNKIGVIGYSWGGLSGSILASKIQNASCLISLDGSEFHRYGQVKEENMDFDGIRYSPDFKYMKISVPYLRLESSPVSISEKEDSIYNFSEKLSLDHHIFRIDSSKHEDFGCVSQVVKESGNCKSNQHFKTISKLTLGFLKHHLKDEKYFPQIVEEMSEAVQKR